MTPLTQLLMFRFAPGASFEGQLLGALERIEAGSAIKILDVALAHRDPETGDLDLLVAKGGEVASSVTVFRLDPSERRRLSAAAEERRPAIAAAVKKLQPGWAMAAILLEHRWAEALDDAITRLGGTRELAEFVDARSLDDLQAEISAQIH